MPKFYVSGVATIGFTEVVEAETREAAITAVEGKKAVDLQWDYEDLEIVEAKRLEEEVKC